MTHSKLSRSIVFITALAAVAMTGAGCAMNAGEPIVDERAESTEADLRKAPIAGSSKTLSDDSDGTQQAVLPKPAIAPTLIGNAPVISGGQEEDGPRPHPWAPAPETAETNTNSGTGSASSSQ